MERDSLKKWVWSVTNDAKQIIWSKNIWAVRTLLTTKKVKKGDFIIFYVKGTGLFNGIFKIVSDWYNAEKPLWKDELNGEIKYRYQCKLEPVILGEASLKELLQSLSFVRNKAAPGLSLRAHKVGPANYGSPLPEDDFDLIMNKMKESV